MNNNQFSALMTNNANVLLSRAMQFTRDQDDAKDLLQETLIRASRFIHRFEEGTDIRAWLFVIMRNTFINTYRKNQKRNNILIIGEDISDAQMVQNPVRNLAEGRFMMNDIQFALNKLPDNYRIPFVKYFEGYKYNEIAEFLGLPVGTIKTHIHQARLMLRKNLKKYRLE